MANFLEPYQEHTSGVFRAKFDSTCPDCGKTLYKGTLGRKHKDRNVHQACHAKAQKEYFLSNKKTKQQDYQTVLEF